MQEKGKQPSITKDGVTVAHFVALQDPIENAVQVIKQAAVQTSDVLVMEQPSTVLGAQSGESHKGLSRLVFVNRSQRGILIAADEVSRNLKDLSHPIRSVEDIEHIATISANNDSTIGRLLQLPSIRWDKMVLSMIEESPA